MGYRDHIVAKLSALAVAGGTTAMLFAATPVHTQFSATTSGTLSASGATVAQTLTNGDLTATGLLPPTSSSATGTTGTTGISSGSTTGPSGWNWTNAKTVTLDNTGSVPETFTLNISKVSDGFTGNDQVALEQLWVAYTAQGTTYYYQMFPAGDLPGANDGGSLPTSITYNLGTIAAQNKGFATVEFALAPYVHGQGGANAWNGSGVSIPYTITAEPSSTQPASGTAPAPTLAATGTSTSAP
jgi:hypothetical protein